MKPPPFRYVRPGELGEALEFLRDHEDAKVLAGGQSLVPLLNFRLARPAVLVDLSQIEELTVIREEAGVLVVGAMVRQRQLELAPMARKRCPLLVQALRWVGHLQIRNRGTVGGSLAHADPAAELCAAALALDATLIARSVQGTRMIAAREFFAGPFMTVLEPDEILTEIRFPATSGARTAFVELARRSGDFPIVAIAAIIAGEPGEVSRAAIAAAGIGSAPLRLAATERAVIGRRLSAEVATEAAVMAASEVNPTADVHADAEYRRALAGTLVKRVLLGEAP